MNFLPGVPSRPASQALGISPGGVVVGVGADLRNEDATEDAWVYENGATARLPELVVGNSSAYGINRAGTIVGSSETVSRSSHAVLWQRQ
jgi:probable HAF family extracellular repeat protein